ncbi:MULTISPECIES: PAS domain-containing hybrid sensor histidine kinase/response regulator [Ramlibacter]|nr:MULTISPECIES: PAS domain-containing hybrid sensor histidine kinase/response regulator [Ramlibacter]
MTTAIPSQALPVSEPEGPTVWLRFLTPLLGLTLLIGALGVVGYRHLSEGVRRDNDRTLAVIAEQKRQQIEGVLADARMDAQLNFASHSQLENLFGRWIAGGRRDGAMQEWIRRRLVEVAEIRGWDGVLMFDASAKLALAVGQGSLANEQERILDIIRRPRIELVDLHVDAAGRVHYGILSPIGGAGQTPHGVAYISWPADSTLYPQVKSWPVPTQTAETYLVRREGADVRFVTPLRHFERADLGFVQSMSRQDMPAARAARGEHGIISGGRDYRNVPVLAYAVPVAGTSWLMLAEIDEVEAYAAIRAMGWEAGVLVGLGLLLVYSGAFLLSRRARQRAELASLQSHQAAESRFRVVFEQAPLGVVMVDASSGRIVEANQRFAEIVGHSHEDLPGMAPVRFTHPDDRAEIRTQIERLQLGESQVFRLNMRYVHSDGSVIWVSLTASPVKVADAAAPRFLFIVEDITARMSIEERLRISEQRHRLLADNAIDVIMTMDLAGRFSYVSPSVERLLGYTVDEMLSQTLSDVLTPPSLATVEGYFDRLRAAQGGGGALFFRDELECRCKDGATVWVELTVSPLLRPDDSLVEILGVARDISERRRYEVELRGAYDAAEAANAAKSEFLAHMSHEIRTPMNAVLGLAQVLQREPLANNQRDMVARIRGAGQSLLSILNDVLDLSKVEAGQLRIEPRPFELSSLLADIDSLMGQAANAKGLTLRVALPDTGADLLLGDGLRLEQVLLNLIGNAIKFTERGEVTLITSCSERNEAGLRLRFEVRDNGIGIVPEALERLFEPFAQADAGISRRYGGTGLGLSICKRLVELMGGQIGATSEPGQGSCFWFELPMLLAEAQAAPALPGRPVRPMGPCLVGAHLLVVDDSAMNRDLVDRALRQEGARVSLAADGQQAVQILSNRSDAFDGVLMDVQMPVMDGLTAIRMIRDKLGMVDLPIIAFTAGVGAKQQAAAREAGANDVLPKPMDLDEMAELLSRWILPRVPAVAQGQGQEPGNEFPDIPGIDRERAAQRLGHDRDIFLSLLDFFIKDNADAVKHVRAELAAGDREAAGRRMHTLASNAGFLCALNLMEVARQAEAAIDRGELELELEAMLDAIAAQVSELVEASQPWCLTV